MLVPGKPKRVVSQAPLKLTACHAGCGATVEYRTTPRVCCPSCKLDRKRASARTAMGKQRRKRGIPQQKGTTTNCARCGLAIVKRSLVHTYCEPCAKEVSRARARGVSAGRKHKPDGYAYQREWMRNKRRNNPGFAVSAHVRVLMHRALGKQKAGRSWRTFVPYTLEELMAHLEAQFLPGMTWDNRGEWHIDHRRPLCSFNFTTPECLEFREAWALSNLQPLWAEDNLRKGGRMDLLL